MPFPEDVSPEDKHKLRQFYRVLLSYADFKHAHQVAHHIIDTKLHERYQGDTTVLLQALNCSMVLAYCRPFSGNAGKRGESIPDLPARYLRVLSEREREIHEVVLFDRNKYLAHTDADASAIDPVRLQIDSSREVLIPLLEDRLAPLDEEATRHLLSASLKLLHKLAAERQASEPALMKYFRVAGPDQLFGEPE
ncbi:hypothetical protein [Chitinimonas taiwanensis]|uniref:HEPN AbiU2-like domain-containing protein n=1 Tax=Chitinimonas taiwanensis DSM 18899 TaxID=1121279 RepID=A0A1K2HRV3_9NEIS|nr:hypothetical protein [Chitinimonas taiwanensis]SFZ79503.1 hypothetical protein SAMN02745887_03686 [Chitinimonas taiwanensis DSM 18899]